MQTKQVQSLGITLRASSRIPMYRQLFDAVVSRIHDGTFPKGFRLPPTRALADELKTHRNTVVRAYEDLAAAGFVESTVGRGTFVANGTPPARSAKAPPPRAPMP